MACSWCGDRIWRDDNYGTDDTPLCRDCYDDHYATCADCGSLIRQHDAYYVSSDSDEAYCVNCYQRHNDRSIHDYYYKPDPLFRGEDPRYFGVELEIDDAGEDCDNADEILDIANWQLENVYCKHDGSLDDGFEIVTHPMSLDYHMEEMPWVEVLEKAQRMGYRSHQASTCGLHVHVSRKAFGETEALQDAAIARVLFFIEKHWNEMLKFSRRTQRQLDQWAARYGYAPDIQKFRGTAWGALNAMADFVGHAQPHNDRQNYAENNWGRIMDGHILLDKLASLCIA